ncbi:MAG: hypothetical protein QGG73_06745, partial [Candidatus Hydrogenedentes bacterium]|nr:hypothetical protein [Candidatus Hydrogenedentota bacterium]
MKKTPWNPIVFTCVFALLAVCVSAPLQAQETETTLRWKNGDALHGNLLESGPGQIRWSSPLFSDEVILDTDALESITFPTQSSTAATGTFRVGTVSGDVFTAELVGSDDSTYRFSSKRYGEFSVNRDSVFSLDRRENPNLIFDGSQLQKWDIERSG